MIRSTQMHYSIERLFSDVTGSHPGDVDSPRLPAVRICRVGDVSMYESTDTPVRRCLYRDDDG
jgi:hypothetical protein